MKKSILVGIIVLICTVVFYNVVFIVMRDVWKVTDFKSYFAVGYILGAVGMQAYSVFVK